MTTSETPEIFTAHREPFTISTNPARLDVAFIHKFLSEDSAWAKGIARATLERALKNSLCFGLYERERQIGFCRVISDYATYACLDDVFVLAEFRGRGLGAWLLESVVAHPQLQGLKRFGLTTMDKQEFYAHFGWRALYYPERHMEKLPPSYFSERSG